MISEETLDEIRERASLLDFASELAGVKQHGGGIFAICPFHHEKTGSFHIKEGGEFYHCFGCGASGNLFGFVMRTMGLSFPEAVEVIAAKYGISVKRTEVKKGAPGKDKRHLLKKLNLLAHRFFLQQLQEAPASVHEYLQERGLEQETREKFGLGYAPHDWRVLAQFLLGKKVPEELMLHSGLVKRNSRGELYDALRGRVVFPILNGERVLVGFGGRILPPFESEETPKYLNSPETALYQKSRVLYGLPNAVQAARYQKEIFVVEGYFDVISLAQSGVEQVVATCGTALTEKHVQALQRIVRKICVLFDGDTAGEDAAAKAFPGFLNSGVEAEAIFLPDGEDPDSLAKKSGKELSARLSEMPRESLFDCYLRWHARKSGGGELATLSPRQKAEVAESVAEVLRATKNPIELDEYVKRAAFLLKTEATLLKRVLESARRGRGKGQIEASASEGGPLGREESRRTAAPSEFRHVHQLLLRSIMLLKEPALQELKESPEVYANLPRTLILFCESFGEFLSQDVSSDEARKDRIRELLLAFGAEWLHFWRSSYLMAREPDFDRERLFRDSLLRLEEERILEKVKNIDLVLEQEGDEERRAQLHQQKVKLAQELKSVR
ncbi:DNA primase [bacterium]|nr:DNA primase [bacterium]